MKKNIFKSIVPVLLCISLVLSILGRINAYASVSDEFWGEGRVPHWNEVDCRSWFDSQNIDYTDDYMCLNIKYNKSENGYDFTYFVTYYFDFTANSEFTYDENNFVVLSNSLFHSKYGRSGKTYVDNDEVRIGLQPAGFANSSALSSIRDSITLKFKEDMSEIYINEDHYTSSDIVYFRYHIGNIENKYQAVRVVFTPPLVGDVDRRLNNGGLNSMLGNIKVDIYNDGDTAIQYRLAIYEKNSSSSSRNGSSNPDVYYGDDPIFVLYKNEWVYSETIPDWKWGSNDPFYGSQEVDMGTPMKYQKPSEWHYIPARSGSGYTIKFSQIHFKQGVEYTVKVDCVTCPYENVSSIGIESDRNYGKIDFSTLETVYQSDFRILQYDDSEYKPDDDSLGILPYDGYAGNGQANEYSGSYLAYDGGDGNIHYENVKGNSGSNFGSSFFPSQSGTEYNTVISHSTSALGFMSTVLSWFPSDIFTCINIALWFSVILFIIKKV